MQVSVIGAGGIGSALGAYLARAGNKVTLVFKEKDDAEAARAECLHVTGVETFAACVEVLEWPAPIPPSDLLIVAVKTYNTREALRCAAGVSVEVALSAQNGMQKEEMLAEVLGEERLLGSVIEVTAMRQGDGSIFNPSIVLSHIGELDGHDSKRVRAVARLLTEAGIPTQPSAIIRSVEWTKTCQWTVTSLLSVMTGYSYPYIYSTPWLRPMFVEIARECAAVASAEGARIVEAPSLFLHHLVDSTTEEACAWLQEKGKQLLAEWGTAYRASMLVDVERGSRTEFDDIVGYIIAKARRRKIPTPALDFAVRQVCRYVGSALDARAS